MFSAWQWGQVSVKVEGMIELDQQREAMARAEAALILSMRQPTVASRMEALQRQFDDVEEQDRHALISVIIARLAVADRSRGPIRY